MSDSIPRDFVWMSDGGDLGDLQNRGGDAEGLVR